MKLNLREAEEIDVEDLRTASDYYDNLMFRAKEKKEDELIKQAESEKL